MDEENSNILKELKHKEKKVADLIRFINNRTEDTPVYSLLLGAGCSISSNIKSGIALIEEWENEIIQDDKEGYKDGMNIEDYLSSKRWYDKRHAYASLFEKRYDLQSQRRAFIEKIISKGNPSIGYAYLVKLIENNFFNTIFTTNFDDLLNEAFYRFSSIRPIVCAHDSAISSITVTSAKPKIIKLHGDYMFENIKNTTRETESLDINMKNKFIEFAKDFGMIVIGYGGRDRSIMDILNMLLKKEEYFKNGIYWCIRKGEVDLSDELINLLWKERVYFVEIEGFDEFMAELNIGLNNGALPIENAFLSNQRQQDLIKSLAENSNLTKTISDTIKKDIDKLKEMVNHNLTKDFFNFIANKIEQNNEDSQKDYKDTPSRKNKLSDLSKVEHTKLFDLKNKILEDKTEDAIKEINNILKIESNDQYKIELLKLKMFAINYMQTFDNEIIKDILKELIKLEPDNETHYINLSNKLTDKNDKIYYIDQAIEKFPFDYYLYKQKGIVIYEKEKNSIKPDKVELKNAEELLTKSLNLNNSLNNRSWLILCDIYSQTDKDNKDALKEKINAITNRFKYIDKANPNYLEFCTKYKDLLEIKNLQEVLEEGYNMALQSDNLTKAEENLILLINYLYKTDKIEKAEKYMEDYEKQFSPSKEYIINKASLLANEYTDKIDESTKLYLKCNESITVTTALIRLFAIRSKREEAEQLFKKYGSYTEIQLTFYENFEEYDKYCKLIDEQYIEKGIEPDSVTIISYLYAKIMTQDYNRGYTLAKKYYDNPDTCNGPIAINYYILCNKRDIHCKIIDKIQAKIINKQENYEDDVLAAAYALMNNKQKTYEHLSKAIKHNNLLRYSMIKWPAFDNIRDDEKFKKIMKI